MARLTDPDEFELRELRQRRDALLRLAERRRARLHRLPGLTNELQRVTNALLKTELQEKPEDPPLEPLGDAGAVGQRQNGFDFYKE